MADSQRRAFGVFFAPAGRPPPPTPIDCQAVHGGTDCVTHKSHTCDCVHRESESHMCDCVHRETHGTRLVVLEQHSRSEGSLRAPKRSSETRAVPAVSLTSVHASLSKARVELGCRGESAEEAGQALHLVDIFETSSSGRPATSPSRAAWARSCYCTSRTGSLDRLGFLTLGLGFLATEDRSGARPLCIVPEHFATSRNSSWFVAVPAW